MKICLLLGRETKAAPPELAAGSAERGRGHGPAGPGPARPASAAPRPPAPPPPGAGSPDTGTAGPPGEGGLNPSPGSGGAVLIIYPSFLNYFYYQSCNDSHDFFIFFLQWVVKKYHSAVLCALLLRPLA